MHQGSVLSPLLFIIVLEALSRDSRKGMPWELLYADDLAIISESLEELEERYVNWKNALESKGLRVNIGKTKVMVSSTDVGKAVKTGKFPCGVCSKGVGVNSIYCSHCNHWIHQRCSGLQGPLENTPNFKCRTCVLPRNDNDNMKKIRLGDSEYDLVDEFCYLGDMLGSGGGSEASSVLRVRCGWKKFRELLPLLTCRVFSLKRKGNLYDACVRRAMLHSSETWPAKDEDVRRLERTEMQMVRWMCGASLKDRIPSTELRDRLGIESITNSLRVNRLSWFGHVERASNEDWISKCRNICVPGVTGKGRPRKRWEHNIKDDLKKLNLDKTQALDRAAWKIAIKKKPRPTHASMENGR